MANLSIKVNEELLRDNTNLKNLYTSAVCDMYLLAKTESPCAVCKWEHIKNAIGETACSTKRNNETGKHCFEWREAKA